MSISSSPRRHASSAAWVSLFPPPASPAAALQRASASCRARLRSLKAADSSASRLATGRGGFPAVSRHIPASFEQNERIVSTFSAASGLDAAFSDRLQRPRSSSTPRRRFRSAGSQPGPSGESPGQVTLSFSSPECPAPPMPSRTLSFSASVSGGRAPVAPMLKE